MDGLRSAHLLTLKLDIAFARILDIGATAAGRRRIAPITGGSFKGERLEGVVLPGGADWVLNRPDGMAIDVRLVLETADKVAIYMHYTGAFRASPEVMQRFNRGEAIGDDDYTLRVTPRFETGVERYRWLNDLNAIGIGQPSPTGAIYTIYEVL